MGFRPQWQEWFISEWLCLFNEFHRQTSNAAGASASTSFKRREPASSAGRSQQLNDGPCLLQKSSKVRESYIRSWKMAFTLSMATCKSDVGGLNQASSILDELLSGCMDRRMSSKIPLSPSNENTMYYSTSNVQNSSNICSMVTETSKEWKQSWKMAFMLSTATCKSDVGG